MEKTLLILIADDDEGDRKLIKRALNHAGIDCECVESENIEDALKACDKYAFDCAILDYWLPGQDGLEGVSALLKKQPYMATIMSTGHGDEMVAAEAMKRGASDYIPKTHISAQSLGRSLKNAIERTALRKKIALQREELENFTRVLVHDFKSPIQSVQGFAYVIAQKVEAGANPAEIRDYCNRVIRGIKRMSALIEVLHGYTKADELVAFGKVEMNEIMAGVLSNLNEQIKETRAVVTTGELPAVLGNAPQLTQLLQNLVANALKYCKAPVPNVEVTAGAGPGNSWLISVKDNGIGIPQGQLQEVFKPFKRLHNVGEYDGTGLGLATCRKIAERHGGKIWCESTEGEGTTLFFTLQPVPVSYESSKLVAAQVGSEQSQA
jgi:signal transduction histidine kinase